MSGAADASAYPQHRGFRVILSAQFSFAGRWNSVLFE
jgi:hypothetical protein